MFFFWFWFLSLDLCGIMNAQILRIHPFLDKESISQRVTFKLVFLFLAIKFLAFFGKQKMDFLWSSINVCSCCFFVIILSRSLCGLCEFLCFREDNWTVCLLDVR